MHLAYAIPVAQPFLVVVVVVVFAEAGPGRPEFCLLKRVKANLVDTL